MAWYMDSPERGPECGWDLDSRTEIPELAALISAAKAAHDAYNAALRTAYAARRASGSPLARPSVVGATEARREVDRWLWRHQDKLPRSRERQWVPRLNPL